MCGICGFNWKDPVLLDKMLQALVHRGPDDCGAFSNPEFSLGMRRLSIVDLTAKQPVFDETQDIVVVMNGELYNHEDIRKDLENRGHVFRTHHSDTEVIPHLFEEYGESFVQKLNGMFAIALWDRKNKTLYLYRDRLGKKPLYVYIAASGKFIAFGSEIKALLKIPRISRELSIESLSDYFMYKSTIAPNTIYKDIDQLCNGEMLIWNEHRIQRKYYWIPDFSTRAASGIEELKDQFMDLFYDSVKIRTRCDVPFGAYLSGGLDSSSVVTVLSKLLPTSRIKTFCLGYKHESTDQFIGKNQDVFYARKLADQLQTEHYELLIDYNDFVKDMPDILRAFDEPFSGTISTYLISRLIREHVTVALSGDGADELFGSYLIPRISNALEFCDFDGLSMRDKNAAISAMKLYGKDNWREFFNVFSPPEIARFLKPYVCFSNTAITQNKQNQMNYLTQSLILDQSRLLPNQVLPFVDRLSMAHSLEVRCPYLDYRLVDFVNSLPNRLKVHQGKTKIFQRAAFVDTVLSRDIVFRKKEGFVQPIYTWMEFELKQWCVDWLNMLNKEIINTDIVKTLDFTKDKAKIWNLVCFSIWYKLVYSARI